LLEPPVVLGKDRQCGIKGDAKAAALDTPHHFGFFVYD